jgi:hypothetical protein
MAYAIKFTLAWQLPKLLLQRSLLFFDFVFGCWS